MKLKNYWRLRMSDTEKQKIKLSATKENISGSKFIRLAVEDRILKTDALESFRKMLAKIDVPEDIKIDVFKLFTDTLYKNPEVSRSESERIKETGIR